MYKFERRILTVFIDCKLVTNFSLITEAARDKNAMAKIKIHERYSDPNLPFQDAL